MIKLNPTLPFLDFPKAECIRINCINDLYKDDALFWIQDEDKIFISMLDGNMTIFNKGGDIEELREFVKIISPSSIFSDSDTLKELSLGDFKEAYVYSIEASENSSLKSDPYNSLAVYEIFKKAGLSLPSYDYFAVDFCLRLNKNRATCFYIENTAAAFSVKSGDYALINGIGSLKKGKGTPCLKGILSLNMGKTVLAVCEEKIKPFYEKNGFKFEYKSGYWVKK